MLNLNKPMALRHGNEAHYIGRCRDPAYPLVMESVSKTKGRPFVFQCCEGGRTSQGALVVNVINENEPEEW